MHEISQVHIGMIRHRQVGSARRMIDERPLDDAETRLARTLGTPQSRFRPVRKPPTINVSWG